MYKILRMIFSIIAAILVAASIFIALYVSMLAFWCCIGGALFFFVLTMYFKFLQEESEEKALKEKNQAQNKNEDKADSSEKK